MLPILNVIAATTFAAALSSRAMEPVLPLVAGDFGVTIATAASLSAVVALTFAVVQPILGAAADMFGKARLMIGCLTLLGAANIIGALATSFEMLFLSRILCGIAAGGTFPVAMGLTSDLVPTAQRQVALGRVLAGAMTGNLLGSSAAGVIGDLLGWRGVLSVLGVLMVIASVAVLIGFRRGGVVSSPSGVSFATLRHGYRTIMANPNARVCFTAVFIEGLCVLGLFPFVAAFLFELGETRASIPGAVIAAFAVGGLFYTTSVSRLLPRFWRQGPDDRRCGDGCASVHCNCRRPALGNPGDLLSADGMGLLQPARIASGVFERPCTRGARVGAVAACLLFFHGAGGRTDRIRFRAVAHRQVRDADAERCRNPGAWNCRGAGAESEASGNG
jgi:predicted MFS family arabinose efflux permease